MDPPRRALMGISRRLLVRIEVADAHPSPSSLLAGAAGGCGRVLVASGGLELWDRRLEPGDERRSESHRRGACEALTVTAGALKLRVGADGPVTLHRGQSASFTADSEHLCVNETRRTTRFTLAVHEAVESVD